MPDVGSAVGRLVRHVVGRGTDNWSRDQILGRTGLTSGEYDAALNWLSRRFLVSYSHGRTHFDQRVVNAWQRAVDNFRSARSRASRLSSVSEKAGGSSEARTTHQIPPSSQKSSSKRREESARTRVRRTAFSGEVQDWSAHVPNEVVFQAVREVTPDPVALNAARDVHRLYKLALEARKSRFAKLQTPDWSLVPKEDREFFLRAGQQCTTLKVDPVVFVQAQFWWFERFGRTSRGRVMLPQVNHLVGDAAFNRVVEYEERRDAARGRRAEARPAEDRFRETRVREQRKLRQLSKLLNLGQREVLLAVPTEFSREFLELRGVWPEVSADWRRSE